MTSARLGALIGPKGRGTNLKALLDACEDGRLNASIAVVVAPNDTSPAVAMARERGVTVAVLDPKDPDYAQRLLEAVEGCALLCLAGYMRLLPEAVLQAFPRRILNIHPSLLPKFGGKGMYGRHVHEAVVAANETESGCTVHYVDAHYDEGEILFQSRTALPPRATPEEVGAIVLELEKRAYPAAVALALESL